MRSDRKRSRAKGVCRTCWGARIVLTNRVDPHELRVVFDEEACPKCGGLGIQ